MTVVDSRLRLKKDNFHQFNFKFHKEKEMADFRKWFFAFAIVALLLGMGTSANAQIGLQTPSFQCVANAAVPPIVRAEGLTELVGDLTLNCSGGTPTLNGAQIPLSNVTVFLNTNITSRLLNSAGLSEATLMIDEPHADPTVAAGNNPIPDGTVVTPPAGSPSQRLCTENGQGNSCPETGTFVGVPSPSPYQTQPNVFSGIQNSASSVVWLGVPIDAPGTAGVRVVRITNVRANAFQLGVSSTLVPTSITMFIAVNGSQQITINNPTQTVAFVQIGLIVGGFSANLLQCEDQNTDLIGGGSDAGDDQAGITVAEGFASSFKRRNIALSVDGVTSPAALAQNVPGYPYNTETGFYAPALFTGTPIVGLADTGTKILIRFNNVGAGVHIFLPVQLPLLLPDDATPSSPAQPPSPVPAGVANGELLLVSADANGKSGPGFSAVSASVEDLAEVNYSGTTGYATYEVVNSDPNSPEHADIGVWIAFFSNTSQNLPAPGSSTVNVSFAPLSNVGTASTSDPIPRFGDTSTPRAAFDINLCTCDLLFPFVTNQAGFDTGVALANTSLDPFGTGTQQGTVKLFYFGSTSGGGAAPPPFTTQIVPAGQELIFNLSSGGNFGVPATPGFQGYIIAVSNFQYCHAFAFISDVGAQKLAEGYLAIQLDFPFNLQGAPFGFSRTGVNGENEGH
jgi:hypothetical protein